MLTNRSLRLVRGWGAAVVATSAAALAHTVAGGPWPSPMLVLLCLALSAPVCMLLAGLRRPGLGLIVSVALSQGLFHHLFAASGTMSAAADHTGHAGHQATASPPPGPELVLVPSGSVGAHHHGGSTELLTAGGDSLVQAPGWLMPALHVVAAVVTIAILHSGEALVRRAAATLLVRARSLVRTPRSTQLPSAPRWRPRPRTDLLVPRHLTVVLGSLRYRGPPRGLRIA